MSETAKERASRGAVLFDEVLDPGWPLRVDVGVMNVSNPALCPAAQATGTGSWARALDLLHEQGWEGPPDAYGLALRGGFGEAAFLNLAWAGEIKQRVDQGVTL